MSTSELAPESYWITAARALRPLIRSQWMEIETGRQLPVALVEALRDAGFFRLVLPRSLGGAELPLGPYLQVIEEISAAAGSVGWNLQIGASGGIFAAHLPVRAAQEIFGDPLTILAGSFNLKGRSVAIAVDGGYRVSGQWGFGSGCQQATWLGGGCVLLDGEVPRTAVDGSPELHLLLFPRGEAEILDTWHVSGLRGTGSHDFRAADVFVPSEYVVPLLTSHSSEKGTLYRFPITTLLTLSLAPVALGIARTAIDTLTELATKKTPAGSHGLLAERTTIQADVARAEAVLRSARAFLYSTVDEVWAVLSEGTPISIQQRALLRLAATHATVSSAQAVDLMYNAGGGSSLYSDIPLERCFRDIHAATQHALVAPATYEPIGRVFLGLDVGTARF